MKKISMTLIAFLAGMFFIGGISWKNNEDNVGKQNAITTTTQHPDNKPILAVRKVKLKGGVSAETFESFAVKVAAGEYGNLPGLKIYYGKGERGDELGSYILFMAFDSKTTRDFYSPIADDNTKTPAEVRKLIDSFFNKFTPEADKLVEPISSGKKGYTDYIILK